MSDFLHLYTERPQQPLKYEPLTSESRRQLLLRKYRPNETKRLPQLRGNMTIIASAVIDSGFSTAKEMNDGHHR
ncbi:MAG: hypothetical protein M3410_06715 [Acidobacteriota bacterium]|nr:hypothetical protein [Acidobacteriota bacterium]